MVDLAGHSGGKITEEIEPGATNVLDRDVSAERRVQLVPLHYVAEITDAAGRESLDGSGGNSVDPNSLGTKVHGKIFDAGLEPRLRYSHHVIMRDHLFGAIVSEREERATVRHQPPGALRDRYEAVDGDVHGHEEIVHRRVDEFP